MAVETLSRAFGDTPSSWPDWDQAEEWDRAFLGISLTDYQAQALRERLLANTQIRLRRTFVEYAVGNLSAGFWEQPYYQYTPEISMDSSGAKRGTGTWEKGPPMSVLVPTDATTLRRRLGKSYDARSEVFHQSVRLDQMAVMAVPGGTKQPLPFAGIRRILDHLLWREIEKGGIDAADLPDVQLVHPPIESGDGR